MKTPSLRRRVVLWSVGTLALLLLVVGVSVDLALGTVLKSEQRQRLESVAALASEISGVSDQTLADRLSMPGIVARIIDASGNEPIVGTPQAPPAGGQGGPPPPSRSGANSSAAVLSEEDGRLQATRALRPGVSLVLTTDSSTIDVALLRFRLIMSIASVAAIVMVALVLPAVLRRAMRPLDALTRAARETAAGGRGRRLSPTHPDTDLGRAAAQFDAMLEELEGAESRAADSADRLVRFLSDASHELRTPIAGVSVGAERLIREPLTGQQREQLAVMIVREARRAGRLVEDLLLASRLDDLSLLLTPQSLADIMRSATYRAGQNSTSPHVVIAGPDARLALDRERIEQVLANLINNATAVGARQLRMATRLDGDRLELRISDDGPGIPLESRERVFDRLVRLDRNESGRDGSGLGLPLASSATALASSRIPSDETLAAAVL